MSKSLKKKHYRNLPFLEALGAHCKKLRKQRGLSIDRLCKESDQLSTSVVHRLESGERPVTVSALARYAEVLEVHPKALFEFDFEFGNEKTGALKLLKKPGPGLIRVFSIQAAAGYFGAGQDVEEQGWVKAPSGVGKVDRDLFVVRVKGHSMEPRIPHQSYAVFRANPVGTRQDKIVLAQYRGPSDPDTGGSYTIKQYSSVKSVSPDGEAWEHKQIVLSPLNPEFEPIILNPKHEGDFKILAEFVALLSG